MAKISVIGICGNSIFMNIDHFHENGETVAADSVYEEIGGKGFNQAIACAKMGAEVSFLAAIGDDADGEKCAQTAADYGINGYFAVKQNKKSTFAVILTDKNGENQVTGYRSAELCVHDVIAFEQEIATSDILLLQHEVPNEVNEVAVNIANKHKVKVILNPAPIREIPLKIAKSVFAVTPNEQERKAIDTKLFKNVITTLGSRGCSVNRKTIIKSIDVTPVDTTGAGDTFNGALAVCIANGMTIKEAAKIAVVASGLSVTKKGVLNAIPTKEEIERKIMMINDFGYFERLQENFKIVNETQGENIKKAASLMADAIENDRLINVYGGGGHTTLCMGEMFFRAGGLSCINPIMETGLSVFNQALKYLELERTVNYGSAIMKYYDLKKDDLLIVFHNIGINPATIDAVMEAKKNGVKIIAISSTYWQNEMPADHFIRHPNKTNLFDYADVCIDDFNPVGDAVVNVPGLDTPIAPVSNIIDFYIAHLLEIECVKQCIDRGITPPVWSSANTPGGDEKNAAYLEKYKPRIKML